MTIYKNPREAARSLKSWFEAQEQRIAPNDCEKISEVGDERRAIRRTPSKGYDLHQGVAAMLATEAGIDPALAADAGKSAHRSLGLLREATNAEEVERRSQLVDKVQRESNRISQKYPKLAQQIQVRLLALQGRGGDKEIAHLTPGEIVVPQTLQTPEFLAHLDRQAAQVGLPLGQLSVGSAQNERNPRTGAPEFGLLDNMKSWFGGEQTESQARGPQIAEIPIKGQPITQFLPENNYAFSRSIPTDRGTTTYFFPKNEVRERKIDLLGPVGSYKSIDGRSIQDYADTELGKLATSKTNRAIAKGILSIPAGFIPDAGPVLGVGIGLSGAADYDNANAIREEQFWRQRLRDFGSK